MEGRREGRGEGEYLRGEGSRAHPAGVELGELGGRPAREEGGVQRTGSRKKEAAGVDPVGLLSGRRRSGGASIRWGVDPSQCGAVTVATTVAGAGGRERAGDGGVCEMSGVVREMSGVVRDRARETAKSQR